MPEHNLEILSPAGSLDTLICAVNNGADAVYIGGQSFSARKNAANFTNEEITSAVKYAHLYGSKVYVTVNTLVYDEELNDLYDFVAFLYGAGVDALIIQDLGVLSLVKTFFPDFEVHASTQMTIHNIEGARLAKEQGFSRVVLSRELTFGEIKAISDAVDIELEVFVHGALCMSYSGQCLMSSFIGARSGNRGDCAQPCRLPYTLMSNEGKVIGESTKYLLSLKDLCLIDEMEELRNCNVKSLKIEGRMKSSEYVSLVTHMYDKYRNGGKVAKEDYEALQNIFSRSGFTKGYPKGECGRNMLNYNASNDKVYDNISADVHALAKELAGTKPKPIIFDAKAKINLDSPMILEVSAKGRTVSLAGEIPAQKAISVPLTEDRVASQIAKSGSTAFEMGRIDIDLDSSVSLPIREINNLRREALELLKEELCPQKARQNAMRFKPLQKQKKSLGNITFNAEVRNLTQAEGAMRAGFDKILVPYSLYIEERKWFDNADISFSVVLPRVCRDNRPIDTDSLNCEVYASNFSQLALCKKMPVRANYSINIFNSFALDYVTSLGVKGVCLSPELNANAISAISSDTDMEIIAYGRVPVMTVQNCIVKSAMSGCGCSMEKPYFLKDRKGAQFPVYTDKHSCTNTIYNSAPIYMADRMDKLDLRGISQLRFVFTTETNQEISKVFEMYKENKEADFNFTRGHYFRGV